MSRCAVLLKLLLPSRVWFYECDKDVFAGEKLEIRPVIEYKVMGGSSTLWYLPFMAYQIILELCKVVNRKAGINWRCVNLFSSFRKKIREFQSNKRINLYCSRNFWRNSVAPAEVGFQVRELARSAIGIMEQMPLTIRHLDLTIVEFCESMSTTPPMLLDDPLRGLTSSGNSSQKISVQPGVTGVYS